jgi:3-phosphoshikimate 1-carboxyvinyltransferase
MVVKPTKKFSGSTRVPPDKSITHRAVMLSALAKGESIILNPLEAEDCLSTLACVQALGVEVKKHPGKWIVHGRGLWGFKIPKGPLNCGNSGTTMRLIAGILAGQEFKSQLIGDASLSKRPMNRIAEPLRQMGAEIQLEADKFAPLQITGKKPLQPIRWKNSVASAQVKSCVLLAGLHASGETSFEEPVLSRDHTERMLQACGVKIRRKGTTVSIAGPASLNPQTWEVPGDISSAAFFLVAGLLIKGAQVRLESVNLNPTRTGLLDVLKSAKAKIDVQNMREIGGEPVGDLIVKAQTELKPILLDEKIAPRLIDEVPILAVAATQARGTSHFKNIGELRFKETDRIAALAKNLALMGANIEETKDGLIIKGPSKLRGAQVDSFEDHRIAMALAVAGLIAEGETRINGSESVVISFPTFWSTLEQFRGK